MLSPAILDSKLRSSRTGRKSTDFDNESRTKAFLHLQADSIPRRFGGELRRRSDVDPVPARVCGRLVLVKRHGERKRQEETLAFSSGPMNTYREAMGNVENAVGLCPVNRHRNFVKQQEGTNGAAAQVQAK